MMQMWKVLDIGEFRTKAFLTTFPQPAKPRRHVGEWSGVSIKYIWLAAQITQTYDIHQS